MEQLKPEEEQMDMMTMMLQQLPQFSEPYTHTIEGFHPPEDHFYGNNTKPLADLIDNNNPHSSMPWSSSCSFTHLPSSTISFSNNNPIMLQEQQQQQQQQQQQSPSETYEDAYANPYGGEKRSSMAAMREMIFRMAAMQPIHIDPESVKPPKRRNVKISKDPQSVAARHRRERISERIRILQRLVPGGTKMDTASMLDEAIHYVKFLKTQVQSLQRASSANNNIRPLGTSTVNATGMGFPVAMSTTSNSTPYFPLPKPYQARHMENMHDRYD